MAQEVIIDIDAQGNVSIEGHGFVGTECTAITKAIEEALGEVTKRTIKPEYHRTRTIARKASA